MNLTEFFTYNFLFEINRVSIEKADRFFLIFGISLVAMAVIFKFGSIFSPTLVDKKYRGKFSNLFFLAGFAEIVWYGARIIWVKFLGSHFVALLILLIAFAWFLTLLVKMLKNYGKEKRQWSKEQVKQKYLPNS